MEANKIVQEHTEPRLDTAESLAFALNVSQAFIRKWTRLGLPHIKFGKATRYSRAEVLKYLKDRQQAG